ncbi:Transmembrane protease, serine 7 [Dimargaris cristalligena]|nr:Transmembrane protease, serine 7 [Dimargaris cristalligena]
MAHILVILTLIILILRPTSATDLTGTSPTTTSPPSPAHATPGQPPAATGKKRVLKPHIINGAQTEHGQFPSTGFIHINSKFACGASIISDRWLISAAHCVTKPKSNAGSASPDGSTAAAAAAGIQLPAYSIRSTAELQIGVGTVYNTTKFMLDVEKVIVHKSFNNSNFKNDIALIQLTEPLTFNDTVKSITIDATPIAEGESLTAEGWGKQADTDTNGSAMLMTVELKAISGAICDAAYPDLDPEVGDQVCTGLEAGKNTCEGDSGGPLVRVKGFAKSVLVGITSVDTDVTDAEPVCGSPNIVSIFTRVAYYIPWIHQETGLEPGSMLYNPATTFKDSAASSSSSSGVSANNTTARASASATATGSGPSATVTIMATPTSSGGRSMRSVTGEGGGYLPFIVSVISSAVVLVMGRGHL